MWRRALILLSFCGLISLAWAQEVRMVPTGVFVGIGTPKVVTPGQTTSFEVRMQLLPPFHAYARGQEGAPEMRFDFPEGVEVLGVDWPKPEKISALGEVFDGYSEQVRWRVRVHISDKMGKGDFPVGVRLNAVICSDTQCFPVEFTESTVLEVGSVASGGINWSGWTEEKETDLLGKMGASGAPGMWGMLLLAFIGGVILNLMPCVFPVLGIKIMSFVRNSGQSRARTVALGGAYAVGILASMWALTGIFIFMRGAGEAIGWGFQLQNPAVIWALLMVMVAVASNLSGWWSFSGLSFGQTPKGERLWGAFGSGVLMVALASPCSGPFLAVAFGSLVTSSATTVWGVMSAIGLGLALPYLILASFPKIVSALPKPGVWMETLERGLAFLMWGAVVYLLWVLFAERGMSLAVGLAVVLAAFAVWIIWRSRKSAVAWGVGVVLLALAALWAWPKSGGLEFESWSEATQQKYLDAGKIVVVDFSARWCVTCQTNEAAVRADRGLKDFLGQRNAALLKADWTNSDPEITKALAGYGRASVPVWVALKGSEKIILPELVSGSDVRKAVQQLAVER